MGGSPPGRQIRGVTDQPDFDLQAWAEPDVGALSADRRADYISRKRAVELCVAGASDREIKLTCGIGLKQAVRLIRERCTVPHPDGRPYGFRALVRRLRINEMVRRKPVKPDAFGRGAVGAMNSLLQLDVDFRRKLDSKILRSFQGKGLAEVKRPRSSVWRWFLDELRTRGYEMRNEWPFNSGSLGYGALCRYVDKVLSTNPHIAAREAGGQTLERKLRAGDGVDRPVARPYQRVEMDAHKLDGRFCVLMPEASGGWVPRIIHRLWVVVIIEVTTRAVLGYHLSLGREVNKKDVMRAIKHAVSPWSPLPVTFSERPLADGAGLPPVLGDDFVGLCWDETSVDGALAETCAAVRRQLTDVIGSRVLEPENSFAIRRSLDDRPFIETFFRTLGDRGLQRLSNSTGANTKARRVNDPDQVAVASQFQYEYLEELLQSLICNANATPHSSLGYRSPLQMLAYFRDRNMLPTRKANQNLVQGLLSHRKLRIVRGGAKSGRPPHVNFEGASYGGPAIRDREDLVGKQVWIINHLEEDARVVRCTTLDGQLIGVLRAAPPWHRLPHSLAVRSSILSLQAQKRISSLGNDAVQTFMQYVEMQPGKKLPVHPAYLSLRRILAAAAKTFEGDAAAQRAMTSLGIGLPQKSEASEEVHVDQSSPHNIAQPGSFNSAGRSLRSEKRKLPAKRLAAD